MDPAGHLFRALAFPRTKVTARAPERQLVFSRRLVGFLFCRCVCEEYTRICEEYEKTSGRHKWIVSFADIGAVWELLPFASTGLLQAVTAFFYDDDSQEAPNMI